MRDGTALPPDAAKLFERMTKCLELTASDNDAEALVAIRKANQLRGQLGLRWTGLLEQALSAPEPPPRYVPDDDDEADEEEFDYAHIFRSIYASGRVGPKWVGIMENIEKFWKTTGRMTPKQHNLVMKIYRSAMGMD